MSRYHIPNPTARKVRNRGWIPCRYRTEDQATHGWIVEKTDRHWLVWLIGDESTRLHPRKVRPLEQRFVVEL